MGSTTILTPTNTVFKKQYSAFCQNQAFLKDQNMKKYQHYLDAGGEVLPTPHRNNDSCCDL